MLIRNFPGSTNASSQTSVALVPSGWIVIAFSLKTTDSYHVSLYRSCIAVNRACPSRISCALIGATTAMQTAKQTSQHRNLILTSKRFRGQHLTIHSQCLARKAHSPHPGVYREL